MVRISVGRKVKQKVQRFLCQSCHKSFVLRHQYSRQKWTKKLIEESIKDYIQGRSSLRIIEERRSISTAPLWRYIQQYGANCKSSYQIAHELDLLNNNRWGHILFLDAKVVKGLTDITNHKGRIKRARSNWSLLLAQDLKTQDIVAFRLAEGETVEGYTKLIKEVKKCGYNIWVVISDDCPAIGSLFALKQIRQPVKKLRQYPRPGTKRLTRSKKGILYGIPQQLCIIHFKRSLEKLLKPKTTHKLFNQLLFYDLVSILFAKTYFQSRKRLTNTLLKVAKGYYSSKKQIKAVDLLLDNFYQLTLHLCLKEGKQLLPNGKSKAVPFSTNHLENSISYIEARLKTTKRFKSKASALNTIRLIILNFRLKPLKEAKNKKHKGRPPLDLATKQKLNMDWLNFSQKSTA